MKSNGLLFSSLFVRHICRPPPGIEDNITNTKTADSREKQGGQVGTRAALRERERERLQFIIKIAAASF